MSASDPRLVLQGIGLFADVLGSEQLIALAAGSHAAFFRRGTLLMTQGDLGGSMFAIVNGTVAVNFTDAQGREQAVATLGPGEVVGEMSMFTGDRRTATVVAATNVDAVEISKTALERVFARSPDLLDKFGAILASRQAELNAMTRPAGGLAREEFTRKARRFFAEMFGRSGAQN